MQIFLDVSSAIPSANRTVVTIGAYDGVHLGHQAVIAEVRLVAQLWLRSGNATCGSNGTAFFLDLWENLPRQVRLRGVRADSGFCLPELLCLWEELALPYVVVAQLSQPIQKLLQGDLLWTVTEVPGTEVADWEYQAMSWPHPRRKLCPDCYRGRCSARRMTPCRPHC